MRMRSARKTTKRTFHMIVSSPQSRVCAMDAAPYQISGPRTYKRTLPARICRVLLADLENIFEQRTAIAHTLQLLGRIYLLDLLP
jgi:hypothetical protein